MTTDQLYEGDPETTTVAQAKDWLRVHSQKGARCPACKQYVKVYKRALGSQMARWLIWLVRTYEPMRVTVAHGRDWLPRHEQPWVDIRTCPVRGGDYAKLIHWGLVEQKPKDPNSSKKTRDSGMWRPTFTGIDFVRGKCRVPSHVYLYDNIKLKAEDRDISIFDALGTKYDYHELMSAQVDVKVPV